MKNMLNEEQEALRQTVAEFAREVVAPVIGEHYEKHTFPYEIVRQMGKMGLFGLPFPEEYGGMGGDYFALCVAIEELARVDSSVAITLEAAVSLGAMPIYRYGTEEQKRDLAAPARQWGGAGRLRPDRARLRLRRRQRGDPGGVGRRRMGHQWQQGVHHQLGDRHHHRDRGRRGHRPTAGRAQGDLDDPRPVRNTGAHIQPGYSKVGWCASDTHEVNLDGVRVPAANLLGERGRGFAQFLRTLDEGRIAIAALATGLAQGCVEESIAYAKQRQAFGQPIGNFQAIQFKIADMEMRAHTARLAWHDAARRLVDGEDFKRYAAIAKLYASEIAVDNAREATQIHGGYGFMNETPVARFWRDSKVLEIGEGTSEVQRMIIARSLGL